MRRPLIVWGATGQAKVVAEFAEVLGFTIAAFIDAKPGLPSPLAGVPVHLDGESCLTWLSQQPRSGWCGLAAIGGWRGDERMRIHGWMKRNAFEVVSLVHPQAFVARSAVYGEGTQILAQASLCAEARLGSACIINTAASVDHECEVGNGVHLAPGARLAGCVTVGDESFFGIGAVVLPRIRIGKQVIVGAGSVVTKDLPDGIVAFGAPARVVRENDFRQSSASQNPRQHHGSTDRIQ